MVIDLSSEARGYFKHSTLREIDFCGEGIFSTPHLFKVLYRKDIVKSPVSLRDSPDCVQLLELFLVNLFFSWILTLLSLQSFLAFCQMQSRSLWQI